MNFIPTEWMNDLMDNMLRTLTHIPWEPEASEYRYKAAKGDERYRRKVERIIETEPTAEEWEAYRQAEAACAILENSPYFEAGGGDYGPELREPETRREYVYAETEDEWIERCRRIEG